MTQELTQYEGKQPLLMKGGLVHWITAETAERIQQQLQSQTSHTFMKISELNITINTAQVEGVYTMGEYSNIEKVKQGMWQCEYRNWHNKGKRECECQKEFYRKQAADKKNKDNEEMNRPLTAEEKKRNLTRFQIMNENAALNGKPGSVFRRMYRKGGDRKIRRSVIDAWEAKNGPARTDDIAVEEDIENETRAEAIEILD